MKKPSFEARRHTVQLLFTALTNIFVTGFFTGRIYRGPLKMVCAPGLNCYSCPGALFACPIGALQAVLTDRRFMFSCYVLGFLAIVGALCGRFVCGFLCPFGFIQDLLHKIPFPKKIHTFKGDRLCRYLKYALLLVFVILLPLFAVDTVNQGSPWFCKWICPAGTLEAGIPLVLLNSGLQRAVGFLYVWKGALLFAVIFLSILIYRPFCKYLCPLGALYGLCNPVSLYRVQAGSACARCKMGCRPNDRECIRCAGRATGAKSRPMHE